MHAVIQVGSHQFDVSPGQVITVEKLDGPAGSEIQFHDVLLYADGETVKVGPNVKGTVYGKITEQVRGPKLIAFKKKRRKGYQTKIGHRQSYTQVEITRIEA